MESRDTFILFLRIALLYLVSKSMLYIRDKIDLAVKAQHNKSRSMPIIFAKYIPNII